MQFNSHVDRLLTATVRLVNTLTPGLDGGREVHPLAPAAVRAAVRAAVHADGYTPDPSERDALSLLAEVRRARQVFELLEDGDQDGAAATANAMLHDTHAHPELDKDVDGSYSIHFHGPDDSFAHGWGAGVAAGLAMAIGGDLGSRLGVCQAPRCDRVYVDRSRNTHRRFCSTRCQSRVKAAAHRQRSRATP